MIIKFKYLYSKKTKMKSIIFRPQFNHFNNLKLKKSIWRNQIPTKNYCRLREKKY